MSVLPPFLLLFFALATTRFAAAADRNVTLDDNSADIQYSGDWTTSAESELDYGGTHQLTEDASATAKLTFTGTAVYLMSPKWPYTVNTAVSVDGGGVTLVDLVDHNTPSQGGGSETLQSAVVWADTGLDNGEHTLTISVGGGQQFAIVDAIVYTVHEEETTSSASSSSTESSSHTSTQTSQTSTQTTSSESQTATSASSASGDGKSNAGTIAAAVTVAVVGMLAVALTFFCLNRRKKKQQAAQQQLQHAPMIEKYPFDAGYGARAESNHFGAVSPTSTSSRTFIGSQGFPSPSEGPKYAHYPQFSPTTPAHEPIPDVTSSSAAPHPYAVAPPSPAPLTTAQLQEAFRTRTVQPDAATLGGWPAPPQGPQPPLAPSRYGQESYTYTQDSHPYAQDPNAYAQDSHAYGQDQHAYSQYQPAYGQAQSSHSTAPNAYVTPPSGVHRLSTITELSSAPSLQPSMQSLQAVAAQPLQPPAAFATDPYRLSAASSEHDLPYLSASPTRQSFRFSGASNVGGDPYGSGMAGDAYARYTGAPPSSSGEHSDTSYASGVPQDAVDPVPTPKRTHSIKRVPPPVA
ncbi:hypothetical protein BD626DRAFT_214489 [Schizophyllum amplum]|uniref:Uncharacterized protein n=1 Tax=Schizophyllum amplum TaxID=97359 RepID=A0A550CK76_9AGAR|nr:hypothetical protein BD626DRAFT_214489 [Auriculariopsis ampla]